MKFGDAIRRVATFSVGPYPCEVYEADGPIDDTDPDGLCECIDRPRRIFINTRCKGQEFWAVMIHELTHLALNVHKIEVSDNLEERICEALAVTLTAALKVELKP